MSPFDHRKYQPAPPVRLPDRQWPNQVITRAPTWCSVDLRDGNQALVEPMNVAEKIKLWQLLVKMGFKEIEVGFPSASQLDFDFVRALIEQSMIPDDVTIQVLVQAREDLIARTYEALAGAQRAVVHVYNSTNPVQRKHVFQLDKQGIIDIAVRGARWVRDYADKYPGTNWAFQYSPESFSDTEVDFAVEVCNAVVEQWQAGGRRMIINLPATVEFSTPNVFADQVEWFCRHINHRDRVDISVHTHNDRGCAVAAAELAVMAGADRVEGTLLGNGERTGNMDIVTMAMNLYSQGINPQLELANMDEIISTVTSCTKIPLHPRHPYAGELVYTAFSGSHQDAIRKCLVRQPHNSHWEVAYLPIDPADIGRSYEAVIRINSQSGKGGVAYVLEQSFGTQLPRWLQIEFSQLVQGEAERHTGELSALQISQLFEQHYLTAAGPQVTSFQLSQQGKQDMLELTLKSNDGEVKLRGSGQGAIAALADAWQHYRGEQMEILDYSEHALNAGTEAKAVAYVLASIGGARVSGVAIGKDIVSTSMQAVMNAVEQSQRERVAA